MDQIASKRQVARLGNGLMLRTDRQLPYIRLKVVLESGAITYLDVDRGSLAPSINDLHDKNIIVVGEWCPAQFHGPGATCEKCDKLPVECACIWPLPRGIEHPERKEYPGGINDLKLQEEIARRNHGAAKRRAEDVGRLPQMVMQKQQVAAFREALNEGADKEVAALRAENANLKASHESMEKKMDAILAQLDGRPATMKDKK